MKTRPLAAAAILALTQLAACGSSSSAPTVTTTVTATATATQTVTAPADTSTDDTTTTDDASVSDSASGALDGEVHKFGETVPGENVTITVAAPTPTKIDPNADCQFTPKGAVRVVITVKNTSTKPWDAASNVIIDATSGSTTACTVSYGEELNTIMPTRTGTITKTFMVPNTTDPFTVSIGGLGSVYWTNDQAALKAAGK